MSTKATSGMDERKTRVRKLPAPSARGVFQTKVAALGASVLVCAMLLGASGWESRYHDRVAKSYNYKFGSNPFLPSQASTETSGFIDPAGFLKSSYCAKCHQSVHAEWRESAHANSFREPFYKKNVELLIESKGIEYTRHCEGCHNPIALFSGALTSGSRADRSFDDDGLSCMVCHSIAKVENTSGTGGYVMGTPAVLLRPDGRPVTVPVSDEEIMRHVDLHSRAVMRDFYRTPEFCAVCHKGAMPKLMNNYKWLRLFSAYDEWQQSSWSAQSPLPFYRRTGLVSCQECHMPKIPAPADLGAKHGKAASHRWLAANTAIPVFYGYTEQLRKTEEFLKAERVAIDIFGLRKGESGDTTDRDLIAPLDSSKFSIRLGETVTFSVVVQNKRIGHSLVPEQRDFYEPWLEFEARDASGRLLYQSGYLEPDGYLEPRAHSYTNRLISSEGKLLDLHEVWEVRTRAYDNTILPGQSDLVRYQFTIPADAQGPLRVSVRLNYRRFRRGFTDWVLGKSADYPVVRMAEAAVTLQLGTNSPGPEKLPGEQMRRWNNYGIALLVQRQYARALQAFQRAVELDPGYVDGYINLAVTNYSYEKFDEALRLLDRALSLAPGDMRATYYRALILRTQGRLDEAASLLRTVIGAYSRFRDARLTLGLTYYQQRQFELARGEFEALQGIDPDDLAAHYNLMLIYRRLGLGESSAQQMRYFVDRKEDPGAASFAHDFLRAHGEISSESVPWHVHAQPAGTHE